MKLRLECLRQLFRRGGAAEPNDATRRVELVCPCLVCNNLRGHALDGINPQHRQIVLYDISRAASKGCCTCALLENGIVQTFPAVRSIPKRVSIHACHYDVERCVRSLLPLRLFIRAMHKSRAIERKIVEFFILPESPGLSPWEISPSPWPLIGVAFSTSGCTGSEKCIEQAKVWLQDCKDNHPSCRQQKKPVLPKRVIELLDFADPPTIRLFEPGSNTTIYADYLCLSHCWGKAALLETTTWNYEKLKECIPWNSLPRTFRDFITVAKHLLIRFVWIDSLSIIQDDRNDWVSQSQEMCKVYERSYLTVFATHAEDSSQGLFSTESLAQRPRRIKGHDPITNQDFCVSVRTAISHAFASGYPGFKAEAPLLTRAWSYQERLMSRRVLHFGRHEIAWECVEATKCECSLEHAGAYKNNMHSLRRTLALNSTREISREWQRIVSEISGLSLTFSSDRLAALAGLAEKLYALRSGVYISGIWTDSIAFDLAWCSASANSKRSKCIAPSWSWASLDSKVFFIPLEYQLNAISRQVTLAKIDKRGSTIPDSIETLNLSSQLIESRAKLSSLSSQEIDIDLTPFTRYLDPNPRFCSLGYSIRFYPDAVSETVPYLPRSVFFFLLFSLFNGDDYIYAYLVLRKSSETANWRFKRIGLCVLQFEEQSEQPIRKLGAERSIVLE